MNHPEELALTLAQTLVEPVTEFSEILYPVYEGQYKLLREKYTDDKEYSAELKKFVDGKKTYIEKQTGSNSFNIENYLSQFICKSFDTLGESGGTYFEHDSVRSLVAWHALNRNIKYRRRYKPNTSDFGTVEVIAESGSGKRKETIRFRFEYLKDKLETAAMVTAFSKLLEEIKSDKFYSEERIVDSSELKKSKSKSANEVVRQKLSWMGDKEVLENIFLKLANSSFEPKGKKVIASTKSVINKIINNNFDFSPEADGVIAVDPTHKLVYNGNISSLLRLLYFLSNKYKNILLLSAPNSDLLGFVHKNFLWFNREANAEQTIELKTLSDEWGKIEGVYKKDAAKLLAHENNPQRKKKSILNIVYSEICSK